MVETVELEPQLPVLAVLQLQVQAQVHLALRVQVEMEVAVVVHLVWQVLRALQFQSLEQLRITQAAAAVVVGLQLPLAVQVDPAAAVQVVAPAVIRPEQQEVQTQVAVVDHVLQLLVVQRRLAVLVVLELLLLNM
jgi:hypothetical protein